MIQKLTQLQGIVLATGGGAILREENRNSLKDKRLCRLSAMSCGQDFGAHAS